MQNQNFMKCRICRLKMEAAHSGMCDECFYLYNIIMKTNSTLIKEETFEKLLAKLNADYKTWDKTMLK